MENFFLRQQKEHFYFIGRSSLLRESIPFIPGLRGASDDDNSGKKLEIGRKIFEKCLPILNKLMLITGISHMNGIFG